MGCTRVVGGSRTLSITGRSRMGAVTGHHPASQYRPAVQFCSSPKNDSQIINELGPCAIQIKTIAFEYGQCRWRVLWHVRCPRASHGSHTSGRTSFEGVSWISEAL
jgi:hypothetical protein